MNPKVEEFLSKAQQAKKNSEKAHKEEMLISLGLCDVEREYGDQYGYEFPNYDSEKQKYYKEKKTAYEVTDEEFAKILEYEKYAEKKDTDNKIEIEAGAERTLRGIAKFTLICGIIVAVVCFFSGCFIEVGYHIEFNWAELPVVFGILMGSIVSWAVLKVFANISISLKEINKKFDKK